MADAKISDLTALTGAGSASTDLAVIVDVSDTTMAASGTDKKMTLAELAAGLATHGSLATDSELSTHASDTTSVHGITDTSTLYYSGGTDVAVADGGTGSSTAAGAATNLGLGTGDSPQFTAVNIGHATDTTITRTGAGDIAIEGNAVYRAGGTDVPVTDGGTGASTAAGARTNLGIDTAVVSIQVTDPNGATLTTGDGQGYYRVPSLVNGGVISAVAAHVTTVSSSGAVTVQIHNVTDAVDVLSTELTIDANEKDSATAATPAVINTSNDDVATADELRLDIDTAGTGAKGLIVELTFTRA